MHGTIYKTIIVDDEKEACDNLENILTTYTNSGVVISGVANDTTQAEQLIGRVKPDAVFLDINMPGENAFQFLERMHPYDFEIIFITAYDEFAIRAFKLNAVNYLQKPICIDELSDSLERLKDRITYKMLPGANRPEANLLGQIRHKQTPQSITLRTLNHVEIVDFSDIYSIEASGNYCHISYARNGCQKEITLTNILSYYEDLLPANMFYRVHKSYIINCEQIADIICDDVSSVTLANKSVIPVSRRRLADFIKFLKEHNLYRA